MRDRVITILEALSFPVYLQGSLAGVDWPQSFFTFWTASEDGPHYDNTPISTIWTIDINFYSTEPALVTSVLLSAKQRLRAAGFIVSGKGRDLPSEQTTYTGRGIMAQYIEQEE